MLKQKSNCCFHVIVLFKFFKKGQKYVYGLFIKTNECILSKIICSYEINLSF